MEGGQGDAMRGAGRGGGSSGAPIQEASIDLLASPNTKHIRCTLSNSATRRLYPLSLSGRGHGVVASATPCRAPARRPFPSPSRSSGFY